MTNQTSYGKDNRHDCISMMTSSNHDDVIKWKHFPRYWPFVRGIHRSRWIPTQMPVTRSFNVFFDLRLNKQLSKQSWGWWFETPWCSLWRHCNAGNAYDNHILRLVYRYYVFIDISIFRRYEILMSRSEDEYIYIYIYICVCVRVCICAFLYIDRHMDVIVCNIRNEFLIVLGAMTSAHFCLLLGVCSGGARPITGQVTSVTWPVIGWAYSEQETEDGPRFGIYVIIPIPMHVLTTHHTWQYPSGHATQY